MDEKIILAIESSCDETAVAIINEKKELLANIVASQIVQHNDKGGVVPELASRLHLENIDRVYQEALKEANLTIDDIDAIAVVNGPGLMGSLHVGVMFAKSLAYLNDKPLLPINHLRAHVYSNFLNKEIKYPLLSLIVSGGHTELVLVKDAHTFELLGETLDDAVGECYDKVARVLNIGYPGGPIIDELARQGQDLYDFPLPLDDNTYNFSYSGLKSAVINKVNQLTMKQASFRNEDIAASFQKKAIDILIKKTKKALAEYPVHQLSVAGGVSANAYLRSQVAQLAQPNLEVLIPDLAYTGDNAAMAAVYALHFDPKSCPQASDIQINPNMSIEEDC
jgi:N6-L-threonylcarbamoyladenine synthase